MKKIIAILGGIYSLNAYAYYTDTIPNQCGIIDNNLYAVFNVNEYTCAAGEFLPAHSLGCESCPDDYTCDGGTYSFNDNKYQGAAQNGYITHDLTNMCATNAPHVLNAVFEPNEHTCAPGYYLPANTDGCVICTANSYCPGGTYTFDETTTQGIETCPNSWYAPRGMSSADQCGRILHIGENVVYLRSVKKTSPSLHVRVDGYTFYGNMTTTDVPMNANTTAHMKVQFNNETYSIYDDTIIP